MANSKSQTVTADLCCLLDKVTRPGIISPACSLVLPDLVLVELDWERVLDGVREGGALMTHLIGDVACQFTPLLEALVRCFGDHLARLFTPLGGKEQRCQRTDYQPCEDRRC